MKFQYRNLFLAVFAIFLFVGCSVKAQVANMAYIGKEKTYDSSLKNQIDIKEVNGGKETNPLFKSEIGNEEFKKALITSLKRQGLFSETGKFVLTAKLLKVDQPLIGIDLTVTTHIKYKIINKETKEVILEKEIIASHTATAGDALYGATRLRFANEGAVKENIRQLLIEISKINVKEITAG